MQKNILWASPDDSVQHALTNMQQHDTGYMMVGTDGSLEGILSKSDITGAISPYLRPIFAKWRRPLDEASLQIKIKWIMTRPVHTINPHTPIEEIMENICQFGRRALPVVDQQGKVHGLVTVFDIFQTILKTNSNLSTVGKVNQAPPLT
jgi:CBS-domain-containing membrane protein